MTQTETAKQPIDPFIGWIFKFLFGLGIPLVVLSIYLAPFNAYEIQGVFREHGEVVEATVIEKTKVEKSYVAGGRGGGRRTYDELVVIVKTKTNSRIEISDLVLSQQYNTLKAGDSVSMTLIRKREATKQLPNGPYYLLSESVNAGTFDLLGWAFNGQPSSGWFLLAAVPGGSLLFLGLLLLGYIIKDPDSVRMQAPQDSSNQNPS